MNNLHLNWKWFKIPHIKVVIVLCGNDTVCTSIAWE